MSSANKGRDAWYVGCQKKLAKAVFILKKVLVPVFSETETVFQSRFYDSLACFSDSGRLLVDPFYSMSVTHCRLISPVLSPKVKDLVAKSPTSSLLFGEDL